MDYWFYASPEDFADVVDHLLEEEWSLYEGYSRPDQEIRHVTTREELLALDTVGPPSIYGWHPDVTGAPIFETFPLNPAIGTWRTRLDGPGIFRFSGPRFMEDGSLWPASFSHWAERTLRDGRSRGVFPPSVLDEVNWLALRRASSRLRRWIDRFSVAALDGRPVLPLAAAGVRSGSFRLWSFGRAAGPDELAVPAA